METSDAVDTLEADTATAAGFCSITHDQVGIDHQVASDTVTHGAVSMAAIRIGLSGTRGIGIRSAHDEQAATVAGRGWVGCLVEQDRVVLDAGVPDESQVGNSSAIAGAQVAANPVVVELVVVSAGAEGDAARTRRSGREQFIALGRVRVTALWWTFTKRSKQYGS